MQGYRLFPTEGIKGAKYYVYVVATVSAQEHVMLTVFYMLGSMIFSALLHNQIYLSIVVRPSGVIKIIMILI